MRSPDPVTGEPDPSAFLRLYSDARQVEATHCYVGRRWQDVIGMYPPPAAVLDHRMRMNTFLGKWLQYLAEQRTWRCDAALVRRSGGLKRVGRWRKVQKKARRSGLFLRWRPQGDSNPRRYRERVMSWASRRWGRVACQRLMRRHRLVEPAGIEPATSYMPCRRSPS